MYDVWNHFKKINQLKSNTYTLNMTGKKSKIPEFVSLGAKQEFLKKFRDGLYDGISRSDIAMQFNVNVKTVNNWITKADIILRTQPEGGNNWQSKVVRKKRQINAGLFKYGRE